MKSPSAFDLDLPKFSTVSLSLSLPRRISVSVDFISQNSCMRIRYARRVASSSSSFPPAPLDATFACIGLVRFLACLQLFSYSVIQLCQLFLFENTSTAPTPSPALLVLLLLHYQHSLAASNHAFACKSAAHRWRNMPGICMQIYLHDATRHRSRIGSGTAIGLRAPTYLHTAGRSVNQFHIE